MARGFSCQPCKQSRSLKNVIKPEILPELLDLFQQDVDITALVPPKVKDDNSRSDGGKLVGLTGIVEGGASIGVEAQRIITAELKKHIPSLLFNELLSILRVRALHWNVTHSTLSKKSNASQLT